MKSDDYEVLFYGRKKYTTSVTYRNRVVSTINKLFG